MAGQPGLPSTPENTIYRPQPLTVMQPAQPAQQNAQQPKGIWAAPDKFAATGNTLDFSQPINDPGALTVPSYTGPGAFTSAGGYVGAPGQSTYVNDLFRGLGIQAPADTSAAISAAGTTALNRAAHEQAVADASRLASMGQFNTGTAAALASRRGIDYGASKADIDMKAKMDTADRQAAFDAMRAGLAGDYGRDASGFNLQSADMKNRFGLSSADMKNRFGLEKAGLLSQHDMARAGLLNDETFRRDMAEHEANVMFPIATAAALKSAKDQKRGAALGGFFNFMGQTGGAAIPLLSCWVAEVLYGKDAQKTHDARLYATTVDTPFTIAYREHGQKWAAKLAQDKDLQATFAPIWDEMAKEGAKIRQRIATLPEVR